MKKTLLLINLIVFNLTTGFASESKVFENDTILSFYEDEDPSSSIVFKDGVAYDLAFDWRNEYGSQRKKRIKAHWSGIGFSFANFENLDSPDLDLQASYSINWNIASLSTTIGNHWLVLTGVGIDWSRYHFKGDYGLENINGITQFVPAEEDQSYRDSKLLAYHVTIPFMLEYQVKDFFINAGPVVYINCYSKSEMEIYYSYGRRDDHLKWQKKLNILPINMRLMGHIGISGFSIFGYYSPFSMFEKNKGPELYPWGAGLKINF